MISDGEQYRLDTLLIFTVCFTESKHGLPRNANHMTCRSLHYILVCSILKLLSLKYTLAVFIDFLLFSNDLIFYNGFLFS